MYSIRPMQIKDLDQVMEIENISFISKWKREDFLYELNENKFAFLYVCEDSNKVVGFIDYWHTFDSATICQIAVLPEYRKLHIGSMLLKEVIDDCFAKRVIKLTLEVRKNNEIARNFYKFNGFKELLVKPKYYSNGEDAIYMEKEVNINA